MPYMHKLSCRLALLKDALIVVSLTALACEMPVRTTGPAGEMYLAVVPKTVTVQPSDTVDLMAVGYTSAGDTANIPVSWSMTAGSLVDTTTKGWRHYAKIKAGPSNGTFKVVAHGNQTTATDTATVTVAQLPVAQVLVTPAVVSVLIGAGVQLTATPQDANGNPLSGRVVNWSTSDAAVASVNSGGLVTGVAAGAATVTATSEGQTGTSAVTVSTVPVASVSVSPASASLQTGQTVQLTATPKDASGNPLSGRAVNWSTSNATVATVSSTGLVTGGGAAGSATITATSEGHSATSAISVTSVPVASVSVTPASASLSTGRTTQLTATPRDASGNPLSGRAVSWTTSNGAVATVSSSGLVTGAAAGSATITATSEGQIGTSAITVTSVPVASVTVSPASASVLTGQTAQLTAAPKDASGNPLSGRTVTWSSGNTSVATVSSSGLVAGVTAGSATITATSEGQSGTSAVTVVLPNPGDSTLGSALPAPLAASTGAAFYVATTGNDANPGTLAQPWKTIQKAMNALQPGQTAYVRAGTYETGGTFGTSNDSQYWSVNCTATGPCSIVAYPGEQPVIHGWIKITGSYLRLSGFIIEGPLSRDVTSCTERRAMQIEFSGGHDVEISHNEIRNNDYHAGIYLAGVSSIQILANYIHDNGRPTISNDPCTGSSTWNVDHGIYWSSSSGGVSLVAGNVFEHNRGHGIQLYPGALNVIVTQNTFVTNGNSGVYISSSSDRVTVIDNIVAFNDRNGQMQIQSGNGNVVMRNIVYSPNSSYNTIENSTSSVITDNTFADPLFVSLGGGDYHLLTGSPGINRALLAYSLRYAFDGQVRPQGAGPDIGAYER